MRHPALFALVLVASACEGGAASGRVVDVHPDSVYAFESGTYDADQIPGIDRLDAAAERGDLDAQYQVVLFRHYHAGDHEAALAEFKRLAAQDHPAATGMVALMLMDRDGAPEDHAEAARWLERAAALGVEGAAEDLAAYRARRR